MIWPLAAISLGLGSNFHCLGMCGPIALAVPVNTKSFTTRLASILLYNLGRILVYAILGAFFGLMGLGLFLTGVQQQLSIIVGAIIVISAVLTLLNRKTNFLNNLISGKTLKLQQAMSKYLRKQGYTNNFVLGLLNGLLPCGLVYVALAAALITGSVLNGILFMILFGIGTMPVMVALPWIKDIITADIKHKLQRAVPVFLLVFGALLILRGANIGIPYLSPHFDADQPMSHGHGEDAKVEIHSCH